MYRRTPGIICVSPGATGTPWCVLYTVPVLLTCWKCFSIGGLCLTLLCCSLSQAYSETSRRNAVCHWWRKDTSNCLAVMAWGMQERKQSQQDEFCFLGQKGGTSCVVIFILLKRTQVETTKKPQRNHLHLGNFTEMAMGETIPNLFPKTASPDQWQRSYLFSKSANHPPAGEERTEEADTSETLVLEEAKLLAGGVASRWGDSSCWNGCRWLKGSQRRETEWTCERFEEMKTWTRSRTYQRHSTGDEQNSTVIPGDILQVMNKTLHQLNQCFPNIPLQLARRETYEWRRLTSRPTEHGVRRCLHRPAWCRLLSLPEAYKYFQVQENNHIKNIELKKHH